MAKEASAEPVAENDKRANFERLAGLRVSKALDAIRVVENMASTDNYEFTAEDVSKIEKAVSERLATCIQSFHDALAGKRKGGAKESFSL